MHFILFKSCGNHFKVGLWSTRTKENLNAAINACWPGLNQDFFIDVISQDRCRKNYFSLADVPGTASGRDSSKPLFLKCLVDFWQYFSEFNGSNTLLVDDTRYKSMRNPWHCCICPPSFDPEDDDQDPNYLDCHFTPLAGKMECL